MNVIKEYIEDTICSLMEFKKDVLKNLAFLIPVLMSVTSIIAFVVGIIAFAIRGGFAEQVAFVKAEGIGHFESLFTSGTVSYVTQGAAAYILLALMTVEFVILTILYFIKESKVKKVILGICLVLMVSPLFAIGGMFGGVIRNTSGLMASVILAMVAVALYAIMMLKACCDWLFLHCLKAVGFSWIAVPLLLLFVENIILLLMFVLMIGILVIGIMIARNSGERGNATEANDRSGANEDSRTAEKKNKVEITTEKKQKVIDYWSEPFWRDKGGLGVLQATGDHIYCYDTHGSITAACLVVEFEKGDVAIIDCKTKKRIMNVAGCKRPVR